MKAVNKLERIINKNDSLLCVGLDSDYEKIPKIIKNKSKDPLYEFNKNIIDATRDLVCSYKINCAFYESRGWKGIRSLEKTLDYIPSSIFTIIDAKRGDIGNSSRMYAKSLYSLYNADSATISPYMGFDSVEPFLDYKDKLTFILCLTSNKGHLDFQAVPKKKSAFP